MTGVKKAEMAQFFKKTSKMTEMKRWQYSRTEAKRKKNSS